ncbi:MAG: hypothetical protein AAF517_03400 [Planctomycetota bacterium]
MIRLILLLVALVMSSGCTRLQFVKAMLKVRDSHRELGEHVQKGEAEQARSAARELVSSLLSPVITDDLTFAYDGDYQRFLLGALNAAHELTEEVSSSERIQKYLTLDQACVRCHEVYRPKSSAPEPTSPLIRSLQRESD